MAEHDKRETIRCTIVDTFFERVWNITGWSKEMKMFQYTIYNDYFNTRLN